MPRYSFSRAASFGLFVPMLLMNLFVVGGLVWDLTPQTQVKIYANHHSHVSPVVSLVTTAIAAIYSITVVLLAVFNIVIPSLPRLVVDSIILWPCHLISLIIVGTWNNWSALKQIASGQVQAPSETAASGAASANTSDKLAAASDTSSSPESSPVAQAAEVAARFIFRRDLTCTDPSWSTEQCAQRWKAITIVQTVAFAFGWICLLLVTIDFILALNVLRRRKAALALGKNPDELEENDTDSMRESLTTTEQVGGRWVNVTGRH